MSKIEDALPLIVEEYSKLKEEQTSRIGYRDNLIYVNLVAVGSIFAFEFINDVSRELLLLIPWVCFILGWMYIVNDEKISSIGRYIRTNLRQKVLELIQDQDKIHNIIMGWENYNRTNSTRSNRKAFQLLVDSITFIAPGCLSIVIFFLSKDGQEISGTYIGVGIVESLLLLSLLIIIIKYTDFSIGVGNGEQTAKTS